MPSLQPIYYSYISTVRSHIPSLSSPLPQIAHLCLAASLGTLACKTLLSHKNYSTVSVIATYIISGIISHGAVRALASREVIQSTGSLSIILGLAFLTLPIASYLTSSRQQSILQQQVADLQAEIKKNKTVDLLRELDETKTQLIRSKEKEITLLEQVAGLENEIKKLKPADLLEELAKINAQLTQAKETEAALRAQVADLLAEPLTLKPSYLSSELVQVKTQLARAKETEAALRAQLADLQAHAPKPNCLPSELSPKKNLQPCKYNSDLA